MESFEAALSGVSKQEKTLKNYLKFNESNVIKCKCFMTEMS